MGAILAIIGLAVLSICLAVNADRLANRLATAESVGYQYRRERDASFKEVRKLECERDEARAERDALAQKLANGIRVLSGEGES